MQVYLTSDLHRGFSKCTVKIHRKFFERMAEDYAAQPDVAALVLAGDLISHRQKQLPGLFRQIRDCLPHLPVLLVWGNHDFWDKEYFKKDYEQLLEWRKEHCQQFSMVDLNDAPVTLQGVTFYGFTGWYQDPHVCTNDSLYMVREGEPKPAPLMYWLSKKIYNDFHLVLDQRELQTGGKSVLVTHFPPELKEMAFARWGDYGAPKHFFEPMAERFDAVLYGHTHLAWNGPVGSRKAVFVNSGSDYDAPRFVRVTV